jgi:hypothetical protein
MPKQPQQPGMWKINTARRCPAGHTDTYTYTSLTSIDEGQLPGTCGVKGCGKPLTITVMSREYIPPKN